ncbi:hypothetical protein BC941DRAFT_465214 [Chlamydoabsidia padenii]|nr:hypothetical protein BC941DRAFT_465214 [Chlamydoabsidia padenii]
MTSRKIAIAIDPSSEEASKTVDWTMENFLRPNDHIELVLVIVLDSEFSDYEVELGAIDNLLLLEQEMVKNRADELAKIATMIKAKGFHNVTTHTFKTGPSKACNVLVEFVNSTRIDCLVMGSRNLGGWKKFFMGSFSDYVQSRIHSPVLIVR